MSHPAVSRAGLLAVVGLALALGCATPHPRDDPGQVDALAAALTALPGATDAEEAAQIARVALETTAALASRYRPLRPPQLGNLAFHLGWRERALCCHWTRDLLHALHAPPLGAFELHWGVAHYGTIREHSAVVVVPNGGRFDQGLILDAWRNAGALHWSRVDTDRYPWRLHPEDDRRLRIVCTADLTGDAGAARSTQAGAGP